MVIIKPHPSKGRVDPLSSIAAGLRTEEDDAFGMGLLDEHVCEVRDDLSGCGAHQGWAQLLLRLACHIVGQISVVANAAIGVARRLPFLPTVKSRLGRTGVQILASFGLQMDSA